MYRCAFVRGNNFKKIVKKKNKILEINLPFI